MVITPNSRIVLIKNPLKMDNYNQITFSNSESQFNYFYNLPKLEIGGATYLRKEGVIRFPTHTNAGDNLPTFENLLQYNYCMYQNTSFSNKWFYAFITKIEYQNDGVSFIEIETDSFQSFQFDIRYMNSFIEREHVSNDTRGAHTLPENVELGEYFTNNYNQNDTLKSNFILVASTRDITSPYAINGGACYGGVYQGYRLYAFPNTSGGRSGIRTMVNNLTNAGFVDAIIGMFLCNYTFFEYMYDGGIGEEIRESINPRGFTWGHGGVASDTPITKLNSLNGYVPKNNKLLTFPYMYLLMDNGNGGQAIYKYENFRDSITPNTCDFDIIGTPSIGGSYFVTPVNYKSNASNCPDERLFGGKLPTCGWQNDTFTNWLTKNAVSQSVSMGANALSIGAGVIAAPFTGGTSLMGSASGLSGITNSMAQIHEKSFSSPQQEGNSTTGDVNFTTGNTTFTAYAKSIKYEYAKCIDDYFSMYGYKVNRLATPNIKKRSNWDYMKCIDVNLEGDIPEEDLSKIRDLFNKGCTFWHTTTNFLNYQVNNNIV